MKKQSVLSMFLLLAVSCSETSSGPASQLGSLDVSVRTTGGDVDLDGYEIVIGPGVRTPIGPNGDVMIAGISTEDHVIALDNVAPNCVVGGTHPREIQIVAGRTVAIAFEIECATTGIEILIRTSGHNGPDTYSLFVDDQSFGPANANGIRVVGRLATGHHTLELLVPINCKVIGGSRVGVEISNRILTKVPIEITCGDVERLDKIAYVLDSTAAGNSASWIVVANSDQSNPVALVKGQSPDWSPDGTQLVFSDLTCFTPPWDFEYCNPGLVVMDPEMRTTRRLEAAGLATEPAWAPAGDVIAFVRWHDPGPLVGRLYVLKLDGSRAVEIPTPGVRSVGNPAWSPDGQRIAFTCVVRGDSTDVCVINRNGSGFVRLTSTSFNTDPAWSPNGSTIAFTTSRFQNAWDYDSDVAIMPRNGGAITRVTAGSSPAWLPDGSKLVFVGLSQDGLFMVNADGSNLTRISAGRHYAPAWRPKLAAPPGDGCAGCWDYSKIAAPFQRRAARD